jgi:hypothetical protein
VTLGGSFFRRFAPSMGEAAQQAAGNGPEKGQNHHKRVPRPEEKRSFG